MPFETNWNIETITKENATEYSKSVPVNISKIIATIAIINVI
jgi:hypothetical protein